MLSQRSQEKELLDLGPNYYSPQEFEHCQTILFRINRLLGFFKDTVQHLKKFPENTSLLDVGCGGGLFLFHLAKHFPQMQLHGVDISEEAIQIAKRLESTVSFHLQHQPQLAWPENSIDIILATLVCHHLNDSDLVDFLRQAHQVCRKEVIINDLQRHSLAHCLYGLISPLFRNRLITHDGLISIRRGFTRAEWHALLRQANISHYKIQWRFPFRWRVILWKQ